MMIFIGNICMIVQVDMKNNHLQREPFANSIKLDLYNFYFYTQFSISQYSGEQILNRILKQIIVKIVVRFRHLPQIL